MTEKEKANELIIEYEETTPTGLYESERQHLEELFIRAINFGKQLKANPMVVIKPPKFSPSELNYLEDLIEGNIEEGSYWGNRKRFVKRQESVKEKIIKLRAAN